VHVKIIEEVTSVLSDQDAAVADGKLAEVAQSRTYGELRRAATRLVLKLDAEAVRKRKEKARGQARVRSFREESGNAGFLAGRCRAWRCCFGPRGDLRRPPVLRSPGTSQRVPPLTSKLST